jgi:hypothetical protein
VWCNIVRNSHSRHKVAAETARIILGGLFLLLGGNMAQWYSPIQGLTNIQKQASSGGNTYPSGFIGPVRPQDTIANPNFIGPTYSAPQFPKSGGGQVLGATTGGGTPTPTPTPDGGGNPTVDLNAGWDEYISSLDQQLSGLEGQKGSQEATALGTLNTGTENLTTQYGTNKSTIEGQQTKTLNDLGESLQGYWQQGNAMLGTRGASDSSAANMYAYALAKLGSKQRGDVMADYSLRLQNLKGIYDQNTNQLKNEYNQTIAQVGQWFAEAQNAIRGLKGQAALQKGQQIVDYGMQLLGQAQQEAATKRNVLDTWVANHATNIQQVISQLGQPTQGMSTAQPIFGNLSGGTSKSQAYVPGNMFNQKEESPLFPTINNMG